jgi:carboxyl-terminal processing protease
LHGSLRAISAACLIAVASLTGVALLAHARANQASGSIAERGGNSFDLGTFLGDPTHADQHLLDEAFVKVQESYYKPPASQQMLDGEQHALIVFLKHRGVAAPQLPRLQADGDRSHDEQQLDKELQLAEALYGKRATGFELTQIALHGMLDALGDPYTTYLSAGEINHLEESLRGGDFGGIGVYIVQDPRTKNVIVDPIEGTPADKVGIKPGDEIVSVDGTLTRTLPLDTIERLIRGRVGTVVVLVVRPHASTREHTVSVMRGHILVPSVHAKMEDGFEYIRLADFGQTSYDEVRHAMLDGKSRHARGYILDLRDNGGGLLDAAVQISSLFIPEGTIVSTIDRGGVRDVKEATHESIGVAPLVLLVNKYTASASEITAGAVQDYKVGTLIGTRTFGKGVVQSIYSLGPESGALKITTARYVTPLGRDIHHKGIKPDIVLDQPIEINIIDTPKDQQLIAAKAFLRRTASK